MRSQPNHKSQFPDLNLLDEESKRNKYENDLQELTQVEQRKFSFIQPISSNDFAGRHLFWSAKLEIMGRILILIAALLSIAIAFLLGRYGIFVSVKKIIKEPITLYGIDMSNLIGYGLLYLSLIFSLLFILPMVLIRTTGGVKRWAVIYITIGIIYFIIFELACAVLIIVDSVNLVTQGEVKINEIYPLLIVLILLATIIQIIGSCFLIVKSDDIKQRMNLEV